MVQLQSCSGSHSEINSILSQLFLEDFVDKAIIEDGGGKVCKYEYCNITDRSLMLCI